MSERISNELTESEEQYRLLGASQPGTDSADHLPFPVPTMGSDSAEKSEERLGDKLAYYGALVRFHADFCRPHLVHRILQRPRRTGMVPCAPGAPELRSWMLHLCTPSPGILTLQPTAHAKTKAAGLQRHQRMMLAVGVPCIALGTVAIEIQKFSRGHRHFATWHGIFGLVSVIWLLGQVLLGGGSVWYGGAAFGGGMKAKMIWKYHRLSGYVLFSLLLITAHLGGAWSTWVRSYSHLSVRFVAYSVAPLVTLAAIYARVRSADPIIHAVFLTTGEHRTSKMKFF
ncbi:hypothetical protein AZE42_06945 [Rhizopogon vesiculosus]|uniref:Cytochrome b561 domain-containing protein n=1 Tax=Rhizopogon vesiculosus TaxID=180088 RepID=A0A1J8RD72_9AGAM|nr:hypothetical protein AZE42_06945 [Rhizopogon vesiculosus]